MQRAIPYSIKQRICNSRCGNALTLVTVACALMFTFYWSLVGYRPAHAQQPVTSAPAATARSLRSGVPTVTLDASRFPTISIDVPCTEEDQAFIIVENLQSASPISAPVSSSYIRPVDARATLVLDLYRRRTGETEQHSIAVAKLLIQVRDILDSLRESGRFVTSAHDMAIFVPDKTLRNAKSAVDGTPWVTDTVKLRQSLFQDFSNGSLMLPATDSNQADRNEGDREETEALISAFIDSSHVSATTGIRSVLNSVALQYREYGEPTAQHEVFVFTDGWDTISASPTETHREIVISELISTYLDLDLPVNVAFITLDAKNNVEEFSRLAAATGGRVYDREALGDQFVTQIVERLETIYASTRFCTLVYETQQAPFTWIEIKRQLRDGEMETVATSAIPALLSPPPPQVEIVQPSAGSRLTASFQVTQALAFTVVTELSQPENRAVASAPIARLEAITHELRLGNQPITTVSTLLGNISNDVDETFVDRTLLEIPAGQTGTFYFAVTARNNFGQIGRSERSLDILPAPTPTPAPPPPLHQGVNTAFGDLNQWVYEEAVRPRIVLVLLLAMLFLGLPVVGIATIWVLRDWWRKRRKGPEDPIVSPISPGSNPVAVLVRTKGAVSAPPTKQTIPIYEELEIPSALMFQEHSRYDQRGADDLERYKAKITFDAGLVIDRRNLNKAPQSAGSEEHIFEPIHIQMVDAVRTFELNSNESHNLQSGDEICFGDLRYRVQLMPQAADGVDLAAGSAESASAEGGGGIVDFSKASATKAET